MRAAIIILVALGALITLGFLAVFLVSSRPWASPIGRNQLALPLVLFGLLALLLVRWIVGPLSAWAWVVGLALLDLVMLWRLIILVRLQLDERRQVQE
jgi:hypothetical protein